MAKIDYKKLGFKCGIEIHQQLEGLKLFCSCPTLNSKEKPDIRIVRELRAVAGETGEVDEAASFETIKGREFVYLGDSKDVCLVECDSEPPHAVNKEALETALEIAQLLDAKIVDEIQFMRKTVIDGSNTSGFQRTALIAADGYVKTSKGRVGIPTICLEEEACQKIKEDKNSVTYRLDRLGIPLVEIATAPDIKDPQHAKETAEKIGMVLRSTGKVKRGIGTIRQDINLSIKGKARVELKGFQDLKSIPKVIEMEIQRQLKEKELGPHVRKVEADGSTSFLRPMPGAARMYPETDIPTAIPEIRKKRRIDLIEDKIKRFEKLGLSHSLAVLIAKSGKVALFEDSIKNFENIKPSFIAETLTATLREIKRKFNIEIEKMAEKEFEEIFGYLNEGKISKDVVIDVLIDYAEDKFEGIEKYAAMSEKELEKEIEKIVAEKKGLSFGALMGVIMNRFKGKIDGKKASEILNRLLK